MPVLKSFLRNGTCLPLFLLLFSCVKDIDTDQFEEIVIPPTAAIDLIYFNLASDDFTSPSGSPVVVRDVVRLEFLDDDYIQNGLVGARFNFIFTNSFSQSFTVTVRLLSETNGERYQFQIAIPPGLPTDPEVVNFTEIIPEEYIEAVKRSIKMEIQVEMQPNDQQISGNLSLESRGFYMFEF